jgi:hypothetical protein
VWNLFVEVSSRKGKLFETECCAKIESLLEMFWISIPTQ